MLGRARKRTGKADESRPGLFFTGTDTGVGKTYVTAAVARILRGQGRRVSVSKPVASGANQLGDRWVSEDTLALAHAAGQLDELERITPWVFAEPLAPSVAARRSGSALQLPDLLESVQRARDRDAMLLVEGVGGLLCPITDRETVAELAQALGYAVVIIARRSLGTLNHTLLTIEAARSRGLPIAGLVMNEPTPAADLAAETNVAELRRLAGLPILAVVPHAREAGTPAALAEVDWWSLGHGIAAAGAEYVG
jgi:dethiobiotin synthetase